MVGSGRLAVLSRIPPEEAAERLDVWVRDHRSLEVERASHPSRRLVGSIDRSHVHLAIVDDNVLTRPKGWAVEFDGDIVPTATGSELRGRVDLPDRRQLDILMWLFRAAGLMAGFLYVALPTGVGMSLGSALPGVIVAGLVWLATVYIKREYLSRAADDAGLIERHLRAVLEAP